MGFIWRALLVRRPLSVVVLYRIDLVYSAGIGAAFGAAAYLQSDLRASGYLSVVYATFTVFARALIVPSSAMRTLAASLATMLPMTAAASALILLNLPSAGETLVQYLGKEQDATARAKVIIAVAQKVRDDGIHYASSAIVKRTGESIEQLLVR